jgi:virginiamycin B lyase
VRWRFIRRTSAQLAAMGLVLLVPGCGEKSGGARQADPSSRQPSDSVGSGSDVPSPGAGVANGENPVTSSGAGSPGASSPTPTAEGAAPIAGLSNGGGPGSDSPGLSASGGTPYSIPIIDGPPPPPIAFDEFDIPSPSQPGWITGGPDGQIWFTHQSTAPSAISKVTVQGTPFALYTTSITNTGPRGVAPGPDGNIWYSKQGGIGRMQPNGTSNEYGVPNGGDSAGIALGPDGNLWFTQQLNNRISRVTPSAQFQSFDVPTPNSNPLAITTGKDGNLWFTETGLTANKIGRITPNGEFSEFAIPTPASNPTGITQGPGDELWFTLHDVAKIGKITPQGEITEYYIPSANRPGRIVTGPDGNLWFTLTAANAIGRITPLGQVSEYAVPTKASDPYDITVGPDENLWFTELSANKIGRVSNLSGGGNVTASEGGARGGELGGDTQCNKDTDCIESGRACGGDVCGAGRVCVLAVSGDPGTCSSDEDCWCRSRGATCADGHCSVIRPSHGQ